MSVKATAKSEARNCACGTCHQVITTKALYKPGHDARHVSALLGGLINNYADGQSVTSALITSTAEELPSAPLRAKFLRAAERLVAKHEAGDKS